ncbi:MAG: hypothetical protein E6045_01595 [Finegoldia magna]|nr:hypothetical protein [Finegoldia magna]
MTEFFRYNEDTYTNINITLLRLSLVLVIFWHTNSNTHQII